MVSQHAWMDLNPNLMAHEQLAAISQVYEFPTRGVTPDVLEA